MKVKEHKKLLRAFLYAALIVGLSWGLYACYPRAANHDLNLGGVGHSTLLTESGGVNNCKSCHGDNLRSKSFLTVVGQSKGTGSCYKCHDSLWSKEGHTKAFTGIIDNITKTTGIAYHKSSLTPLNTKVKDTCGSCHGSDLKGAGTLDQFKRPSCTSCHGDKWTALEETHTFSRGGNLHGTGLSTPTIATTGGQACSGCHGADLTGSGNAPSCTGSCHGELWKDISQTHKTLVSGKKHQSGLFTPETNCAACHGGTALTGNSNNPNFTNGTPSCYDAACHTYEPWKGGGSFASTHTEDQHGVMHKPGLKNPTVNCTGSCHGTDLNGGSTGKSCLIGCHGSEKWTGGDDRSAGKFQ